MKNIGTNIRTALEIGVLALLYVITARLGQLLAIPPGNITPPWIPSGVILAAVLWRGYRVWPGIFIGAFAGNLWSYFNPSSAGEIARCLLAAAANGIGDTLYAVGGAYLILRTTGGRGFLERAGDAVKFIGFGAVAGTGASAVTGVTSLSLAGIIPWTNYFNSLATWWTGGAIGVLVFTPALMAWRAGWRGMRLGLEDLLYAVLFPASALAGLALMPVMPELIVFPVLLGGAFRLDRRALFTANALGILFIMSLTASGFGPFATGQARGGWGALPVFVLLMTVPGVMVAGARAERSQMRDRLRKSEQARRRAPEPGEAEAADWEVSRQRRSLLAAILLAGLAATCVAAYYTRPVAEKSERREFEFDCRAIQDKIASRLGECEYILRSGAAFIERMPANAQTRKEWRRFVELLLYKERLSGVQGVGFSQLIPRAQLAPHIEAIRTEGLPDYQVRPAGDREIYTAIIYLEPFNTRNLRAIGYDMWSDPVRRLAMERARDLDAPSLSAKVRLVQETERDVQAGTLMYVPVYQSGAPVATVDQRRAALRGWVYSPYRMTDLMQDILGGWDLLTERRIRLKVFDGAKADPVALLYDSQSAEAPASNMLLAWQSPMEVAGREWTLECTKTGGATSGAKLAKTWLVLFGGAGGSLLMVMLVSHLLAGRFQARRRGSQLIASLRENEARLTAVMQATDNGILLVSPAGKVLSVNQQFARMWRIPDAMLQGGDDETLLRHVAGQLADPEEFSRGVERMYRSNEQKADLLQFKDGRVFARYTNVVELASTRIGRLWSFRDVTDQAQAEITLRQQKAELERLLYTVSHDLKSPLVTVRTFIGYLEQDLATAAADRIEKDMSYIRNASKKMAQLLDDLLGYSRLDHSNEPPVRVAFRNIVDSAVSTVAGRITERGIKVTVGGSDVTLNGDRIRLEAIWQNLIENACKFMGDQKEPSIEIGAETRDANTVFFVRDNGIGIDPRYHAKIFDMFEKLDPKADGTGIGLTVVKKVVELYQGRIWVESPVKERGACFYFTLPGAAEVKPGKQEAT